MIAEKIFSPLDSYIRLDKDGIVILGQDQDSLGGNFDKDQSFSGEMSQFGMWDYVLDRDLIKQMAECQVDEQGSIVNWNIGENWQLQNVQ